MTTEEYQPKLKRFVCDKDDLEELKGEKCNVLNCAKTVDGKVVKFFMEEKCFEPNSILHDYQRWGEEKNRIADALGCPFVEYGKILHPEEKWTAEQQCLIYAIITVCSFCSKVFEVDWRQADGPRIRGIPNNDEVVMVIFQPTVFCDRNIKCYRDANVHKGFNFHAALKNVNRDVSTCRFYGRICSDTTQFEEARRHVVFQCRAKTIFEILSDCREEKEPQNCVPFFCVTCRQVKVEPVSKKMRSWDWPLRLTNEEKRIENKFGQFYPENWPKSEIVANMERIETSAYESGCNNCTIGTLK